MHVHIHQMMCTRMFIAALLTEALSHWQRVGENTVVYLYSEVFTVVEAD